MTTALVTCAAVVLLSLAMPPATTSKDTMPERSKGESRSMGKDTVHWGNQKAPVAGREFLFKLDELEGLSHEP
jgi:hypothetical protein